MLTGWFGDKYHLRGPACAFNAAMALMGLALVGFHGNARVRYLGVFFATAGANANVPVTASYQANNIRGQWKRALCSATLVGAGGIGGIIGATVFRSQDSPKYIPGIIACLIASVLTFIITALLVKTP